MWKKVFESGKKESMPPKRGVLNNKSKDDNCWREVVLVG